MPKVGYKHTEETKRKISKAGIGRKLSQETKKKISDAHKGKILSTEHREKLSIIKIGKKLKDRSGENHYNWRGGIYKAKNHRNLWSRNNLKKKNEKIAGRERPNKCELCNECKNNICFDHDHATGIFRGWICRRCNITLGLVKDDVTLLTLMIKYLKK